MEWHFGAKFPPGNMETLLLNMSTRVRDKTSGSSNHSTWPTIPEVLAYLHIRIFSAPLSEINTEIFVYFFALKFTKSGFLYFDFFLHEWGNIIY